MPLTSHSIPTTSRNLNDKGLVCKRAKGNEYTISDDRYVLEFYNAHKDDDIPTLVHAVMTNEQMWGQDLTKVAGFEEATVKNLTLIREQAQWPLIRAACNLS